MGGAKVALGVEFYSGSLSPDESSADKAQVGVSVPLVRRGIASRENKVPSEIRSAPRSPRRWVCGEACDVNFLQIVYGGGSSGKGGRGAGREGAAGERAVPVCGAP